MSVYKRGCVYWYDFWFRGIRYRESTGLTNKRAATDAEAIRRAELAEGRAGIVHRGPSPSFEEYVSKNFSRGPKGSTNRIRERICGTRSVQSHSWRFSGNFRWMQSLRRMWRSSRLSEAGMFRRQA